MIRLKQIQYVCYKSKFRAIPYLCFLLSTKVRLFKCKGIPCFKQNALVNSVRENKSGNYLKLKTESFISFVSLVRERFYENRTSPALSLACIGLLYAYCDAREEAKFVQLCRAAKLGYAPEIERLIAKGVNVNERHKLGWTALHVAAINGNCEAVEILLKAGADPNLGDEFSNVYQTASERGLNSLDVLIRREDEFNDRLNNRATFRGFTALHYAVLADDAKIVKLLLKGGADPAALNDAGHPPIKYAREKGEIAQLLEKEIQKFETLRKQKEAEQRRRFPLEQRLKQHIVGQEGPITAVASGDVPQQPERPTTIFTHMFTWSNGVRFSRADHE
ncbi:hypothetical protein J437_LFUL004138 [Ladona fulva]|uniref:Uncharacterized protein n=1 Tax=Ladona fulva TaxID=123851 RepID=A0A8K0K1Q1_LADFU|nr:hypothetical protein J437_LFUL004138 [Ladona fulva]